MRDSSGNSTYGDATATLSRTAGTGTLGGTLTGAFSAASANTSVTISGVTYTKAESGVKVKASGVASGVANFTESSAFTVGAGAVAQLEVTSINRGHCDRRNRFHGSCAGSWTQQQRSHSGHEYSSRMTRLLLELAWCHRWTITGTIAAGASSVTIKGVTLSRRSGISSNSKRRADNGR